jgi:hypothetical protein
MPALSITSCSPEPPHYKIISQANNVITLVITGYTYSCPGPQMFIQNGTSWTEVVYPPNSPEGYYLDNQYINPNLGCDVIACVESYGTAIDLSQYTSTGEQETPIGYFGGKTYLVPSYRSVPIHGKIKITFTVYKGTDGKWGCTDPTPVEFIINN